METTELLFEILRSEVNGEQITIDQYFEYDSVTLYQVAKAHDLMYCVTDALYKVGKLPKEKSLNDVYVKEQLKDVARAVRIERTIYIIRETLNEAKIPFVPLKGARISSMYPNQMMRANCDIDILVKEENLEKAITALLNQGFITDNKRNYHDVSLFLENVHLELHFNICESMKDVDVLLEKVWEYVEHVSQYEYHETPEFFVYHHLAHMKYHFINGGCGVRSFLDLFVMRKNGFYDENKLLPLLETVGLTLFYKAVLNMIAVWFEKKPHTELTRKCEEYILKGGFCGSTENSAAVHSSMRNSRIRNAFHAIFPKYSSMCRMYPKLNGHKILLPLYYFIRIFKKTFKKSEKNSRRQLKQILSQDQTQINSVGELLIAMGLKK